MNDNVIFKRKFRYTLEGTLPAGVLKPIFVKVSVRPNAELNLFSDGWHEFQATISEMDTRNQFWSIMQESWYENGPPADDKLGTMIVTMYDGCGDVLERYHLHGAYLSKLLWGDDLPCEEVSFDMTFKFKSMTFEKIKDVPTYHGVGLGLGSLGSKKTKCPNCQHEFTPPSNFVC